MGVGFGSPHWVSRVLAAVAFAPSQRFAFQKLHDEGVVCLDPAVAVDATYQHLTVVIDFYLGGGCRLDRPDRSRSDPDAEPCPLTR